MVEAPITLSFIWWHQIAVWPGIAESWEKKRKFERFPRVEPLDSRK